MWDSDDNWCCTNKFYRRVSCWTDSNPKGSIEYFAAGRRQEREVVDDDAIMLISEKVQRANIESKIVLMSLQIHAFLLSSLHIFFFEFRQGGIIEFSE